VTRILRHCVRSAINPADRDGGAVPLDVLGEPTPWVGRVVDGHVGQGAKRGSDDQGNWPTPMLGETSIVVQAKRTSAGQVIGKDGGEHSNDDHADGRGDGHSKEHRGHPPMGLHTQPSPRQDVGQVWRHRSDDHGESVDVSPRLIEEGKQRRLMGEERGRHGARNVRTRRCRITGSGVRVLW
jgi:hypothetical protein